MSPELDEKLTREHPVLFGDRYGNMRETCMCWGFECGDGWYDLIKEAADKLELLFTKHDTRNPPRALQVKEKYGTLRFYLTHETEEMSAIVREAERKSALTCEECGKPGKVIGGTWLYCRCRECFDKMGKDYGYDDDFDSDSVGC